MRRKVTLARIWLPAALILALVGAGVAATDGDEEKIANTIGPEDSENACSNCHANEIEAWKQTHHYSTFKDRHRTERAKEILENMGLRSMKRDGECRQCHYTSVMEEDRVRAKWGVSCESCHGPAKEWNDIHNKAGGDPGGATLKWGDGKQESAEQRAERLGAAQAKGMIHSDMIYDIATNCFGCHTVPNELLVNKGKHKAGSDYDLVAWSQGEVRHNFLSSPGAPDNPSNRPASAEEKRLLYVVGAMVDLEFSLRNLSRVAEQGGDFHQAMTGRVNHTRERVAAILKAVEIPGLAAALEAVPATVDAGTSIDPGLPDKLSQATRELAKTPPDLSGIDDQIPTDVKGDAYE